MTETEVMVKEIVGTKTISRKTSSDGLDSKLAALEKLQKYCRQPLRVKTWLSLQKQMRMLKMLRMITTIISQNTALRIFLRLSIRHLKC